jgi:hypothetical protein
MKSRRPVALRSAPQEPSASLPDRRRDFFKDILQRIQDLPDNNLLPQDIQDELKKYSRTQTSEKTVIRLTDYPVFAVKSVVSSLLRNLDGNLATLINNLLKEIRLTDDSLKYMSENAKLKINLEKYIRENLSKYLPTLLSGASTDVPMEQLQKDLSGFFAVENGDNIFDPLFHSFIPEEKIKTFLATSDFIKPDGQVSIGYFISKFINEHKFDLIQELFEKGFQPTSPQDWKDVLPRGYYDSFPLALWKLREWGQFLPFVELSKRYSLSIHDFIKYSFYKDHERLIRMGQEIRQIPIRPSKHAPFMKIYDENEMELLQRTRPWVEGLICVLIKPKKNCELYLSKPYGKFYFPNDAFYKDLANPNFICQQEPSTRVFSMKNANIKLDSELYVFHLLKNGQIVPQTLQAYEKGVQYMTTQHSHLRIAKVEEYFLSLPYENMSPVDQDTLRDVFVNDLSFFLSTVFDDKLDFDRMAFDIVSSILSKIQNKSLKTCLERVFQVCFLFNPRYNMNLLSSIVNERMNLFFYQLDNLDELPVEFYYPQYHFLEQEKQQSFDRWRKRCMDNFTIEKLYVLFAKNYPILKVKLPEINSSSSPPKTILLNVETGEKLSLLLPYLNQYIYLPEVAESIHQNQEYIVDGNPISPEIVLAIEHFFDIERVRAGLGSYLMDNDYELVLATSIETRTNEYQIVEERQVLENLPDFKEKAYKFLDLLSIV